MFKKHENCALFVHWNNSLDILVSRPETCHLEQLWSPAPLNKSERNEEKSTKEDGFKITEHQDSGHLGLLLLAAIERGLKRRAREQWFVRLFSKFTACSYAEGGDWRDLHALNILSLVMRLWRQDTQWKPLSNGANRHYASMADRGVRERSLLF